MMAQNPEPGTKEHMVRPIMRFEMNSRAARFFENGVWRQSTQSLLSKSKYIWRASLGNLRKTWLISTKLNLSGVTQVMTPSFTTDKWKCDSS
jgi:hypothetical protein